MRQFFFKLCMISILLAASMTHAETKSAINYQPVVNQIIQLGDDLLAHYTPQTSLATMDGFSQLYFDHYEASGMELAVATLSPATNVKTEALFAQLIGAASKDRPLSELQKAWLKLRMQLNTDLELLKNNLANNFFNASIQAFGILLREGLEALLIVTALLTYLRRSETHQAKTKIIYYGVGIAMVASFITAYLFATLFKNLGAYREAMEGITMLFASAVMFYVSYWLFAKRESAKWQQFIKTKVTEALSSSSRMALGLAAFLAVYREGAETILFYQALIVSNKEQLPGIAAGFIAACVALILLYKLMQRASFKIPYRLFFTTTAVFLYLMSFSFIGRGVLELQQAGWIDITPANGFPQLAWLGIFPAWQNIGAQLIFLLPTLMLLIGYRLIKLKKSPAP